MPAEKGEAMSKVDISSEAVERLAKTADLFAKAMKTWQHKTQKHNEDVRDTLRAQAERIKELEGQKAAGLRREKDANERAMKHLRRAEKAEIASKNHAAFSHEWRERAENAEAENAILRTEKHADAEAIASARNDALREAASVGYGTCLETRHGKLGDAVYIAITALIKEPTP